MLSFLDSVLIHIDPILHGLLNDELKIIIKQYSKHLNL